MTTDTKIKVPTYYTILKAIALADGVLKGHPNYLTKRQMIKLAVNGLSARAANAKATQPRSEDD